MGDPILLDALEAARRALLRGVSTADSAMLRPLLALLDRTLRTLRSETPDEPNADLEPDSARNQGVLRALLENTPDIVFAKDLEGRYLMINRAGAQAIGRPIAEIVGHSALELLPADVAEEIMEDDRQVIETGDTRTGEGVGDWLAFLIAWRKATFGEA